MPTAERDPASQHVVRRVLDRLRGTGLVGETSDVDPATACREAAKVRDFLNMEIPNVRGDDRVDASFKLMRRSARDFVRAGGPDAGTFVDDPAYFTACLRAMRLTLDAELTELTELTDRA